MSKGWFKLKNKSNQVSSDLPCWHSSFLLPGFVLMLSWNLFLNYLRTHLTQTSFCLLNHGSSYHVEPFPMWMRVVTGLMLYNRLMMMFETSKTLLSFSKKDFYQKERSLYFYSWTLNIKFFFFTRNCNISLWWWRPNEKMNF